MDAPTDRDVKRLFAASGNRCAFPKCDLAIAGDGNSLIGEICHICGKRPNSARYDANQSDLERHAFENLILLCANHHKVIDDDEESYPVARLRKMKAVHAAKHLAPPYGDQVDRIVKVLIDRSVSSIGQSGGLTAGNVNALYGAGLSFYGRAAMLLTLSFKERRFNNWRNDDLLIAKLLSVFPRPFVDECKQMTIGGLSRIAVNIDEAFLTESRAHS